MTSQPDEPTEAPAPAAPSALEVVDSPEGQAAIAEGRADFAAGRYEPLVPAAPSVIDDARAAVEMAVARDGGREGIAFVMPFVDRLIDVAARVPGGAAGEALEAAAQAVLTATPCTCIDAYKDRDLNDPTCAYHNIEPEFTDLSTALAAARAPAPVEPFAFPEALDASPEEQRETDEFLDTAVGPVGGEGLEAMRHAGLRPTVYVCAPGAVKPWACGWSWTDSKGRSQSRHELGETPDEAIRAAVAAAPAEPGGG